MSHRRHRPLIWNGLQFRLRIPFLLFACAEVEEVAIRTASAVT